MGKPAARKDDFHVCPMVTGNTPHVGGPVSGPSVSSVLIDGMPAAVMGDKCSCAVTPDTIIMGSAGVFIGGKPAARMGDPTGHGGVIQAGCKKVLIGEVAPGTPSALNSPVYINIQSKILHDIPKDEQGNAALVIGFKNAALNGDAFVEKCKICMKKKS